MTERDESAEKTAPPAELLEAAARSVTQGASLASVAGWFNVPEAQLAEWIAGHVESPVSNASDSPAPVAAEAPPRRTTPPARRPAAARPSPIYTPAPVVDMASRSVSPSPKSFRMSLGALRRRYLVVVIGLLVGAGAGWFTAPGATKQTATYQATHTLIYEGRGSTYNIEQVALLATSGEVPSRVAGRLKVDRAEVRSSVSAAAKSDVSTISITGRSSSPDGAVALADATAEELVAELAEGDRSGAAAEVARLQGQLNRARDRFNAIPPKNAAERAAAQADVQAAERALQQYETAKAPKSDLRTLEEASASTVRPAGVQTPNSKPARAGLLGLFGLLAGAAGAIVLDRLDSRIRSKVAAEEAFRAPVITEVPRISKPSQGQMLALTQASSPFVEAYRGLRTYVALWAPEADLDDGHRVIVVTSPSPSEGKTTTAAHLAAMLAEIGRTVVVVSADLRRPRLHQYFDMPAGPGLVDALAAKYGQAVFTGLDQVTSIRGVRLVASGPPMENPAPLFEHAEELVQALRPLADFVIIDAPPLLVANDAIELARHADGVLFVARAGHTPLEAAERCAETLRRLDISVVGTVLVGSDAASSASRYYASHYYAEPDRAGRRRRRTGAGDEAVSPAPTTPESVEEVLRPTGRR